MASPQKGDAFFMKIPDQILTACLSGKSHGQFELFQMCFPHMMKICDRYHKNDQDAKHDINEAFLKILTHLQRYDPERSFYYWMKQILVRTIIDNFRKKKAIYLSNYEEMETMNGSLHSSSVVWNDADLQLDADDILGLIKKLPNATQQVFNLFVMDGYSHVEIAEILGISNGTSKWHLFQARKQLKVAIAERISSEKSKRYV